MVLNLLNVATKHIKAVQPHEVVTLYKSKPLTDGEYRTDKNGDVIQGFEVVQGVECSFQTESDAALYFADHVATSQVTRKVYLYTKGSNYEDIPFSALRTFARSGDFLKREDGTFWKVLSVPEDFAAQGWISLRVALQVNAPPVLREYLND